MTAHRSNFGPMQGFFSVFRRLAELLKKRFSNRFCWCVSRNGIEVMKSRRCEGKGAVKMIWTPVRLVEKFSKTEFLHSNLRGVRDEKRMLNCGWTAYSIVRVPLNLECHRRSDVRHAVASTIKVFANRSGCRFLEPNHCQPSRRPRRRVLRKQSLCATGRQKCGEYGGCQKIKY